MCVYHVCAQMMLYLTCDLRAKGLNVLQYASKKGATRLLDEVLSTPYVFRNPVTERFDVTFLIPDTVPELPARHGGGRAGHAEKPLSCLELIVNSRNEEQAEDVLGVYPFCELVRNYWVLCRRVYNVFLVVHVLFMILFTVFAMPSTEFIRTRFNSQRCEGGFCLTRLFQRWLQVRADFPIGFPKRNLRALLMRFFYMPNALPVVQLTN